MSGEPTVSERAPTPGLGTEMLRRPELARFLAMSLAGLKVAERDGRIGPEPIRFGGRVARYWLPEVRCWLAAGAPARLRWSAMRREALRKAGVLFSN